MKNTEEDQHFTPECSPDVSSVRKEKRKLGFGRGKTSAGTG